jgi:glutaredoxin-related protein
MVTLYTTNCPRCSVLEKKLELKNIDFEKNDNVDEMIEMGFMSAPILKVDDNFMEFTDALRWVGEQ